MLTFFKNFARGEDSAVTVDWVAPTAAVVGLTGEEGGGGDIPLVTTN